MASRGALGGLSRTTAGVVQALDAAGFDVIIIETVGAGQAEVDIARMAHTTVVVTAPGMGDEVQAIKAGIMEIADILLVNKADLPGAENTVAMLRAMLAMAQPPDAEHLQEGHSGTEGGHRRETGWEVPVLAAIATQGEGIDTLHAAVVRHKLFLQQSGEWSIREQERIRVEMHALLRDHLAARFLAQQPDGRLDDAMQRVFAKELSPGQAIERLLQEEGV
jgi:LAO/AO transport system kinase